MELNTEFLTVEMKEKLGEDILIFPKLSLQEQPVDNIQLHACLTTWLPEDPKVKRVLELGCNVGYFLKTLHRKYGDAVGIDINEEYIKHAKLNHQHCHVMDAENLSFRDNSFSAVVAKNLCEYTIDPDAIMKEAYRVLDTDGYFIVMGYTDGENVSEYVDDKVQWLASRMNFLSKILDAGFTELEYGVASYKEICGSERVAGDSIVMVRARKRENTIRLPHFWILEPTYWAAFITFVCTGNCSYCIQQFSKDEFFGAMAEYEKDKLTGAEWVDFYNHVQKMYRLPLSIIGGEPLLHDDVFEILNNINGYKMTITSNLCSPQFDKFATEISEKQKKHIRINTSFHPNIITVEEFCNKIHMLRNWGYEVDQVAMVNHPTSNYRHYYKEFINRGINMSPQTYLGKIGDVLYPNADSLLVSDHREHGIDNLEIYEDAFSYRRKKKVLCRTKRFMAAPNGNLYRCHYHLYANRNPIGNVLTRDIPKTVGYDLCNDYGYCNPCDFHHVHFKEFTETALREEILK